MRDIRASQDLAQFEAEASARRLKELETNPIRGPFDAKHLKAIHGYIFQDVYAWAGEFRTVNIAKSGQFYFAFANQIAPSVNRLLDGLKQERHLRGLDLQAFSQRASHYLTELNAIHPFRDGNGRAQREFIRTLALHNGCRLNWSRVSGEQMRKASRISFEHGDTTAMEDLVRATLETNRHRDSESGSR